MDEKLEFSKEQEKRIFEVKEFTQEYCRKLTDDSDLVLDEKIKNKIIKDVSTILMNDVNHAVYYPSVVAVPRAPMHQHEIVDYINNEVGVRWEC